MRKTAEELGFGVPEEWGIVSLGKTVKIIMGQSPPSSAYNNMGEGLPFLQGNAEFGIKHPTLSKYSKVVLKVAKKEDVLISVRAPVGEVNIADQEYCIGRGVAALRPHKVDNVFLFYLLKFFETKLKRISTGSTFKSISKPDLENLTIPYPPLPEQHKIAEILSTFDKAVELVDQIIEKSERLKKGLMQKLLTRGIGHKKFKFVEELGFEVPEGWEVVKLAEVTKIRANKGVLRESEVAFIPMELIPDSSIYAKYKIRKSDKVSSYTYCEQGDLLLAKITPSVENGKQGIVPKVPNGFALATTEVFPIVCSNFIDTLFLFYLLKLQLIRNKIIFSMIGTTGRQRVQKNVLENLIIPLPLLPEQRKIAGILSTVDKKIE
ncbi:MAG: hypothetical protein DRN95_08775, partial [Candidatus Hydrothermarchaeota archaeon]